MSGPKNGLFTNLVDAAETVVAQHPKQLSRIIPPQADAMGSKDQALDESLALGKTHAKVDHRFVTMIRKRDPIDLAPCLEAMKLSGIIELSHFATSIEQDRAEVIAALSYAWSSGPVEGHVNRLKMVKRQMFGRANFDLLRQRVLQRI